MTQGKKKRARRGSGSVRPQGDRWRARASALDPLSGERVQRGKTFDTREAAQQWLSEQLTAFARGEGIVRSTKDDQTLEEFITHYYVHDRRSTANKAKRISVRTAAVDLDLIRRYVFRRAPGLAATPLRKVTTDQLAALFRSLSDGSPPLAEATISRVFRSLRARFNDALEFGLVARNPCRANAITVEGTPAKKKRLLSIPQAQALEAVAEQDRYGLYFRVLLWTGCRPGEAAALQWADFDAAAGVLRFQRNLVRVRYPRGTTPLGDRYLFKSTKTDTARDVLLPAALVAALEAHRVKQAAEIETARGEWAGLDLIFCTPFGLPLHLDLLNGERHLKKLLIIAAYHLLGRERPALTLKRSRSAAYAEAKQARMAADAQAMQDAKMPPISLYELRHLHGSLLLGTGAQTKLISARLGHADTSTTERWYLHPQIEDQRDGLAKLEARLTSPMTGPKLVPDAPERSLREREEAHSRSHVQSA